MTNPNPQSAAVGSNNGDELRNKPTTEGTSPEVLSSVPPNPYQPSDFWIDPSMIHSAGAVKKIATTIPVRKPNQKEFFRTRPGEEYWKPVALLELDRDLYLILPQVVPHLDTADFHYSYLFQAISKSGVSFFWPVKINNQRRNSWNESALTIAQLATTKWVKIRSRQEDGKGSGFYEAEEPIATFPDPTWPPLSQKELIDIAFKGGRIIDRVDHEAIKKLSGEIS